MANYRRPAPGGQPEEDQRVDAVAAALANRGRRAIVTRLATVESTSSELAELLDVGLPAVLKQAAILRDAGVIDSTKSGRTVTHALRRDGLDPLTSWIATRTSFWNSHFDALAGAVEER